MVKYVFQKWKKNIAIRFNFLSNHLLANLDGATDYVTSQSSERIDFHCNHDKADTKMFTHIKFLCDNTRLNKIIIVSPDTDVTVISFH